MPFMKNRLVSMFGLVALTAMVALGADIDGKWMSEAQGKGGPQTLTLKAAGDKLTGTLEGGRGGPIEISEGMVHGSDVMFKVVREGQDGTKRTTEYKGTVAGSDLKLTVTGGRGPQDVTFKKQ